MSTHKHITEPSKDGFQVRVVRNKKEYSRYFSHKLWGGKKKSLEGAISWREQILVLFGDIKPIPLSNKSTGIIGISKSIQYDKRRDRNSLVYHCHWRLNKKAQTKTFVVGVVNKITPDQEFHAFRTAIQFRKEYELYKEMGKESLFSPEKYKQWKAEKVYG